MVYLILVLILILLSALFSSSETALFSLDSKSAIARLRDKTPKRLFRRIEQIEQLLSNPPRLLGTILVSNLIVNIAASALWTLFVIYLAQNLSPASAGWNWSLAVGSVVMTLILLIFGDTVPKVFAQKNPQKVALLTSRFLHFSEKILAPVIGILSSFGKVLIPKTRGVSEFPTRLEFKRMIELGKRQGVIVEAEEAILENLLEFNKRTVSEVMTPRIALVSIERSVSLEAAIRVARDSKFSRIPVYDGGVDNIIGVLHIKDIIPKLQNRNLKTITVDQFLRPVDFFPETKRLSEALEVLRKRGSHIAVVVDEFGQTAGIVTLEDILEAILGEIKDEYDTDLDELPYFKVTERGYLVDGEIDLKTLNRLFDEVFEDLEFERLSGFIQHHFGRLPRVGDSLVYKNLKVEVKEVRERRLEKVLIQVRGDSDETIAN